MDLARAFLYLNISTQIGIDRIEIERAGPSYAIDTAKALRERFGSEVSLTWLMGADSLISLPTWNSWQDLIGQVNFAVASRPNHDLDSETPPAVKALLAKHQIQDPSALENSAYGLIYIDNKLSINLSSTELRKRLKSGPQRPLESEQIPSHALEIITNLGLYQ